MYYEVIVSISLSCCINEQWYVNQQQPHDITNNGNNNFNEQHPPKQSKVNKANESEVAFVHNVWTNATIVDDDDDASVSYIKSGLVYGVGKRRKKVFKPDLSGKFMKTKVTNLFE